MNLLLVTTVVLLGLTSLPYVTYALAYFLIRPEGSSAKKNWATEPTYSIVLPTYNEEAIIERKLEDLLAIDYPMEIVELVVVDSSEDATADRVAAFFGDRDHPDLKLIREDERRGVAAALNIGYEAATGELVFRTDCDSLLAPDVLREGAANLADPAVGAVTGHQTEVLGGSQVETDYRSIQALIQLLESHLDSTYIFHGPCFAFERRYWTPLDEDSLADDTEVAVKIRRQGKRVIMDPALAFSESGISDFRKRRQRKDRRAMGLVRLLVRHRDALGRYGNYGRVVLPFNWWFMIVSPWLVALDVLLVVATALSLFGFAGLAVPFALVGFVWLGQQDSLGPLQPLYALFDTQISLLVACLQMLAGRADGTWVIDRESREAFE